MWMYDNFYGKQSTFPEDGNTHRHAFNEGMRMALLLIVENLREQDMNLRKEYEEYIKDRLRKDVNT